MAGGFLKRCIEKLEACDGHIKVDGVWMSIEEYRNKYLKSPSCEGAGRMPCADDTTPAECQKCKGGQSL